MNQTKSDVFDFREFDSREEAEAAIQRACGGQGGWTVLVSDDPANATMGYSVFRQVDKDGNVATYDDHGVYVLPPEQRFEQGCHYSWPATKKRLEAEVLVTDNAQELLLFLAAHSDLKKADRPEQKLMGFARHDVQAGTSLTYRMHTATIHALEDRSKAAILSRHAAVHDAASERMKRAVALAGTLLAQGRADARPE